MNKKLFFSTALGGAAFIAPLMTIVASSGRSGATTSSQMPNDSIWNPTTILDQNKTLNDQDVKDTLAKNKNYGNYTPWTTKTLQGSQTIRSIVPDDHGSFFVVGDIGLFKRIDFNGNEVGGLSTPIFGGSLAANDITSDGTGGFVVVGADGKSAHVDVDGNAIANWTKTDLMSGGEAINSVISDGYAGYLAVGNLGTLVHIDANGAVLANANPLGTSISKIVSDNKGGFVVVGVGGKSAHVDASGVAIPGWTTIPFLGGSDVYRIISDGSTGFFVGGQGGKLDHIDANGVVIASKVLINAFAIRGISQDGLGGFFVIGDGGVLDHVDASGDLVADWTTKVIGNVVTAIVFDGLGGFILGGTGGKINHIYGNGLLYGFNSWAIPYNQEQAKYTQYQSLLENDWPTSPQQPFSANSLLKALIPNKGGNYYVASSSALVLVNSAGVASGMVVNPGMPIFDAVSDGLGGVAIVGSAGTFNVLNGNGTIGANYTIANMDDINTVIPNITSRNGKFFVAGENGKIARIDSDGTVFGTVQTISGGLPIYDMVPDGLGGYLVASDQAQIDRIDNNGLLVPNGSKTIQSMNGVAIQIIVPDGLGGFIVGGRNGGFTAHIGADGTEIPGWTTSTLVGGTKINDITPDGSGGFFVAGQNTLVDHIDANGVVIESKKVSNSNNTQFIVPDSQGGFFVGSDAGGINHIDANLELTKAETKDETLARWRSHSQIALTTDVLDVSDFSFASSAGTISLVYTGSALPSKFVFEYSSDGGLNYLPTQGVSFAIGDQIKVRLGFADASLANYYDFKTNVPIDLTVPKNMLSDQLSSSDFAFANNVNGGIDVSYGGSLSSQLEIQYSVDNGTNWSTSVPTSLNNGDVFKVRLAVLAADQAIYDCDHTPIDLTVKVKTALKDTIAPSDFTFTSLNRQIDVNFSKAISLQLELDYSLDGNQWSTNSPTLNVNDTFKVRLAVKSADQANYELPNNSQIDLTVANVKTTLTEKLVKKDFVFIGANGKIVVKYTHVLPPQLQVEYSLDGNLWTTDSLDNLKSGDILKARLAVKQAYQSSYDLQDKTPLDLTVANGAASSSGNTKLTWWAITLITLASVASLCGTILVTTNVIRARMKIKKNNNIDK